jgi:hypothetical protein
MPSTRNRRTGMNRRTILIALTAALAVVVVLAVWFTVKPPADPEISEADEDDQRVEISRFELDLIKEMKVQSPRGELKILKAGDQWLVDYPYEIKLDTTAIEDLTYSFARLYSEKIVSEEPGDLAEYGLDPPVATAEAALTDGTSRTFYLGNRTPARNTYYLRAEGDPRIYAVWMNHGEHFQWTVDDVRERDFPTVDPQALVSFRLLRREREDIVLRRKAEDEKDIRFSVGFYEMIKPYRQSYGVDTEDLNTFLESIPAFRIEEFVADNVNDFSPYGLARPAAELYMQDEETTVHLYFGDQKDDNEVYFRQAGVSSVYTVRSDQLEFLKQRAFPLVDKFAFIVNIDDVDRVAVTSPETSIELSMAREGEGEEEVTTYFADGKEVEEDPFKKLYQSFIGLFIEAELEKPTGQAPEVIMTYHMNKGGQPSFTIEYIPHDVDFYEVRVDGSSEFLMSREQIRLMLDDIKKFLAEHVAA